MTEIDIGMARGGTARQHATDPLANRILNRIINPNPMKTKKTIPDVNFLVKGNALAIVPQIKTIEPRVGVRKSQAFSFYVRRKWKRVLATKPTIHRDDRKEGLLLKDDNPFRLLDEPAFDIEDMIVEDNGTEVPAKQMIGQKLTKTAKIKISHKGPTDETFEKVCMTDRCVDGQDVHVGVGYEMKEYEKQLERIPARKLAKISASPKSRFIHSQLLNFLRCKHFMHYRDHHFITTLVADARAWLLSSGLKLDTHLEYSMLSLAVTQAFLVSQEELNMRALMKDPRHLNHIEHLNATMTGDLGRVFMFKHGHPLAKLRRPFMKSLTIQRAPAPIV